MNKTMITEPCAHCHTPVTVTASTMRTRYGGKVQCDRCAAPSAELRFATTGLESRAVTAYDEWLRCDGCAQLRRDTKRSGNVRMCKNCRENFRSSGVEAELAERATWTAERRASYDAVIDAVVSGDTDRVEEILRSDPYYGELRDDYDDDGFETREVDDESRFTDGAAEVRGFDADGYPEYGEEPDGVPRDGVVYAERWWNPKWCAAEERRLSGGGLGDWRDYGVSWMELV